MINSYILRTKLIFFPPCDYLNYTVIHLCFNRWSADKSEMYLIFKVYFITSEMQTQQTVMIQTNFQITLEDRFNGSKSAFKSSSRKQTKNRFKCIKSTSASHYE